MGATIQTGEIGTGGIRGDKRFGRLVEKATEAARLLKLMANERRMQVLCNLAEAGELTVGELGDRVDLGQSALSQHLALMREDGLVTSRRDGLTMRYRIADPIAASVLATLRKSYCP